MPQSATILVAHGSEEERAGYEVALFDAGYQVISAGNGEEALRSTAGLDPDVVVVFAGLPGIAGLEIHSRLQATGLKLPPFIITCSDETQKPTLDDGTVYLVSEQGLTPSQLVAHVRMLLLANDMSGEFGATLDTLHGDLARTPFGELAHALLKHVITGRLVFAQSRDSGLWVKDGEIVDAWWGRARGVKAFNRLAGLPRGSFSLQLEEPPEERTIDMDVDSLVTGAVDERLAFDELIAELPSLDSRPAVKLVESFFDLDFNPIEQAVISFAQEVKTFGQLIDGVPAPDVEVLRAADRLRRQGILELEEPAGRIHIFTDSTADIIRSDARRLGVSVLGVSIVFGSEVFKDGVDLQPEDFHRKLKEGKSLPVTNPVTRGEFLEAYRRVVTTGDILSIHCSAKLSKSYENAVAAAEDGMDEFREMRRQAQVLAEPQVMVVNSRQAASSLGMLVGFASRLVRVGLPLKEVAARIESMGRRFRTLVAVSSLDYLVTSGEFGREQVSRGKGARAILAVVDGELRVIAEVPKGSNLAEAVVERLAAGVDPARPVYATVVHSSAPAQAAELRPLVERRFTILELADHHIGPAVTTHVGPGAVGASVFQPTEDELELLKATGA